MLKGSGQAVDEGMVVGLGVWCKVEPSQHSHPPTGLRGCCPHCVTRQAEVGGALVHPGTLKFNTSMMSENRPEWLGYIILLLWTSLAIEIIQPNVSAAIQRPSSVAMTFT